MAVPSKICESCGRPFEYRKRWAKNWAEIKYCSDECRRNKNKFDYQAQILEKLKALRAGATISVDDVLSHDHAHDAVYVEHVKRSARLLAQAGEIEILQKGKVVDPETMRGDVVFRRR